MGNVWHWIKQPEKANCSVWINLINNGIHTLIPKKEDRFVPSECQSCWKVVVRPKTLVGLFELEALMERWGFPSKCGIEVRDHTPAGYGGYFYTKSKQAGFERLEAVREALADNEILRDAEAYLKRGCTEFEMGVGDSADWKVREGQREIEDAILGYFRLNNITMYSEQPPEEIENAHKNWVLYGWRMSSITGDYSYRLYLDRTEMEGHPFLRPIRRYEKDTVN